MRVTRVFGREGVVTLEVQSPPWQRVQELFDKPLTGVEVAELYSTRQATMELVSIAVGGSFAMHSGPEYSFCQIVEGQGKLGLPGGEAVDYRAPELFIFDPDTVHDWHDITAETLVAVCSVKA